VYTVTHSMKYKLIYLGSSVKQAIVLI